MWVITATNENLIELVQQGKFRKDLYYRLNVVPIHLPPLRNRKQDIPLLVRHFADKFSKSLSLDRKTITQSAMNELINYNWPGNIRELMNVAEKAVIMTTGDTIESFDINEFQGDMQPIQAQSVNKEKFPSLSPPLTVQIENLEKNYLTLALQVYKSDFSYVY